MRNVARKSLITVAAAGGALAVGGGYAYATDAGAHGEAAHSPGVLSGNTVQAPVRVPVNACGNTVTVIGGLNPASGNSCVNGAGHAKGHPGKGHPDQGHGHPGKAHGHPGKGHHGHPAHHGGGHGGSEAHGKSAHSPGVASGNTAQAPVHVPVNVCGNTVDVVGALNPASGNRCANVSVDHPHHPGHPVRPDHPGHPHKPGTPDRPDHRGETERPDHRTPDEPRQPERPGGIEGTGPQEKAPEAGPRPVDRAPAPKGPVARLAETGSDALGLALPLSGGLLLAGTVLYRRTRAKA
ncbi:chaplin family protein [Streptomyces sp. URMC 123]|uniref:chaplin n=1 Tax=Streptomyces sp. URMC 123 TaxID=3423403 RepID=UPI003F1D0B2F